MTPTKKIPSARERSRRTGFHTAKNTVVLICEGSKTEKLYFNRYKSRHSGVRIEIPNADKYTDPVNLVKYAVRFQHENQLELDNGDSIWVVYDVDQIPDESLLQAHLLADMHEIQVAHSNPSFELWYLLHFETTTAYLTNKDLGQKLKAHVPRYSKSISVFEDLEPRQEQALLRANSLNKYHQGIGNDLKLRSGNPSTQVFRLVEHIKRLIVENIR